MADSRGGSNGMSTRRGWLEELRICLTVAAAIGGVSVAAALFVRFAGL